MSNSSEAYETAILKKLSFNIVVYFNIILSSIGIPCNLLSIYIFARLMRHKTNMGFLYVWQCSIDLGVLLHFLILYRSANTLGINLAIQSDSWCKFITILGRFILHASSWIAVLTTFDRFTFVLYGHATRFRFLKSKRNLTFIILTILVIIAILDIPNLFYRVMHDGSCKADFAFFLASDVISICLRTYFPFTIMIFFNISMILKIYNKNRTTVIKHASLSSRKETQFTLAVIAFDIYFFILNFPFSLYFILYDIYFYSGLLKANALFPARYNLAYVITGDLAFCEQTLSFFMYLAFNKLFRNEFLYIVGRIFRIQSLSTFSTVHLNPVVTIIHIQH